MGDIGERFSDKSKEYKDIRSTILLSKVIKDIKSKNFDINNIDINVITQTPKLKKFKKKGSVIIFSSIYGVLGQNTKIYKGTKIQENMNYSIIILEDI